MEKLIKKLQHIKSFPFYGIRISSEVKKLFDNGNITLQSDKFDDPIIDNNRDMYQTDLTKNEQWDTYDDCVTGYFLFQQDKIEITITMFDGNQFTRKPVCKRWIAEFTSSLNNEVLKVFEVYINREFLKLCETKYETELLEKKKKRIKEIEQSLLK